MELNIISSGSSGNCSYVEYGEHLIFIDVGVALSRVVSHFGERSVKDKKISLFVTHEHNDHIRGILPFFRKFRPDVYASQKTAEHLFEKGIHEDKLFILEANYKYSLKDFEVIPFNITHDAAEPFGFRFEFGDKKLAFATDLGSAPKYILEALKGVETLILEFNYEDKLLEESSYPHHVKQRIFSSHGHLSNKDALNLASSLSSWGLLRCFLAHISENSNDYELLRRYAGLLEEYYGIETTILEQHRAFRFQL